MLLMMMMIAPSVLLKSYSCSRPNNLIFQFGDPFIRFSPRNNLWWPGPITLSLHLVHLFDIFFRYEIFVPLLILKIRSWCYNNVRHTVSWREKPHWILLSVSPASM